MQKVPLAVTVKSAIDLQQHQVTNLFQLANITPSLQVTSANGIPNAPSFSIRGIGTSILGPQVEPSVAVVVDDIPLARIELGNIELFDMDHVEVLMGPQGMLFGKNASAGLINVVTKNPELNETDFISHTQLGFANGATTGLLATVDLAGNIPITDDSALRIDGSFTHSDGVVKNVAQPNQFNGENNVGGRGKFLWQPTEDLRVLVAADFAWDNGPGDAVQVHSYDSPTTARVYLASFHVAPVPGFYCGANFLEHAPPTLPPFCQTLGPGVVAGLDTAAGITASRHNDEFASIAPQHNLTTIFGISAKVDYDLGDDYTLTNVVGYRKRDTSLHLDASGVLSAGGGTFFAPPNSYYQWQTSEELRLTSPSDQQLTWQAGFFYQDLVSGGANVPGPGDVNVGYGALVPGTFPCIICSSILSTFTTDSLAAYFEGTFKILPTLRLTAGGRFTHDTMHYNATTANLAGSAIAFYPNNVANGFTHFDDLSGRASLEYDVTDDVMAYVSAARGYKGPTFNALPNFTAPVGSYAYTHVAPVGPEIPEDYELGVKSTLFDGKLRLNVDAFQETFFGFQTQAVVGTQTLTVNAGRLKTHGVEAQFDAAPLDGLSINGGVTWNHTAYDAVPTGIGCYTAEPQGSGPNQCNSPLPLTSDNAYLYAAYGGTNINGNQLAQAPEWTEQLTVRYEKPVWGDWQGFIQGDGIFKSSFNFSPFKDPNTQQGATAILGLSIGANSNDGHFGLSLYVRNLTDQRVPVFLFENGVGNLTGPLACGAPALVPGVPFCGDNRPNAKGDYSMQLDPDSFRQVGVSLDYHM